MAPDRRPPLKAAPMSLTACFEDDVVDDTDDVEDVDFDFP